MSDEYTDPRIEASADALTIRHYYLPWGDKRIPHGTIRSVRRIEVGALRGRRRIWGTANPRYWANLDPGRPGKKIGFVLDLGHSVRPFVTPDDPAAFEAALRAHSDAPIEDSRDALII
ncbi:MAG TPA: hypothetical protein VH299_03450 [Solirubrobacterales bacterium]|jgi:hypothetical protein|nr:hypothetical protein [Solirubrobacterales bacterium]